MPSGLFSFLCESTGQSSPQCGITVLSLGGLLGAAVCCGLQHLISIPCSIDYISPVSFLFPGSGSTSSFPNSLTMPSNHVKSLQNIALCAPNPASESEYLHCSQYLCFLSSAPSATSL